MQELINIFILFLILMILEKLSAIIKRRDIQLILIFVITFLAYFNIFSNEFVWDDIVMISWVEQKSLSDIPSVFKGEVASINEGYYRPLLSVYYILSYELFENNPFGYHLISILVHLICTFLVYFIVLRMTNKSIMAFISSLLFGVHPVHTEAVTFMQYSLALISVLFFFLAFYLYLNKKYYFSVFFFLLAILGYEPTLILALLIILYDLCTKNFKKERLGTYGLYFGIIIFYFLIRLFILKINFRFDFLAGSFYYSMLTMTKVFLKYILLIILPFNLSVDHIISKGIFANIYSGINKETILAQSIFDFHILFSIFVILALIFIAIKTYKKYPIVSFCIGWFFIALTPVSNIIPHVTILAERYLYIPSFGAILLFSYLSYNLYKKINYAKVRKILILIFVLIVVIFGIITYNRNKDWKNEITFWSDAAKKSSPLGYYNLGVYYHREGNLEKAVEYYQEALNINPYFFEAYNNLGYDYQSLGKRDLAIENYKKALELNPNLIEVRRRLNELE